MMVEGVAVSSRLGDHSCVLRSVGPSTHCARVVALIETDGITGLGRGFEAFEVLHRYTSVLLNCCCGVVRLPRVRVRLRSVEGVVHTTRLSLWSYK